jgi:hypothetical protein
MQTERQAWPATRRAYIYRVNQQRRIRFQAKARE